MIQVLNRAFDVLEWLAEHPDQPQPLSAIAGALKLNTGTCANIIKTMIQRGYIEQIAPKKGYQLGARLTYLAQQSRRHHRLLAVAEPWITRLAQQAGENVLLVTLQHFRRSILCHANGNQLLQLRPDYLMREDVYQVPTGRLLLAYLPEEELNTFIQQQGLPGPAWPKADTPTHLREQCAQIRRKGELTHVTHEHVIGIAMPVSEHARVVAALGMYLPAFRFKRPHKQQALTAMRKTCRQLHQQLSAQEEKPCRPHIRNH